MARLILKSVKEALELEKFADDEDIFIAKGNTENELGKEVLEEESSGMPKAPSHSGPTGSKNDLENSQIYEFQQAYVTTFQFSVLQYEKGR